MSNEHPSRAWGRRDGLGLAAGACRLGWARSARALRVDMTLCIAVPFGGRSDHWGPTLSPKLADVFKRAVSSGRWPGAVVLPEVKALRLPHGLELPDHSPQNCATWLTKHRAQWAREFQNAGVKPDA